MAKLRSLIPDSVGRQLISNIFGDLSGYEPDDFVPLPLPESNGVKSARDLWERRLEETPMTIRQVYEEISMSSGHCTVTGTVETIADHMQDWFESGACDGWNLMAPYFPAGAEDFLAKLIPELKRRGIFHTEYEGNTLRESLGLPYVPNRLSIQNDIEAASDRRIAV